MKTITFILKTTVLFAALAGLAIPQATGINLTSTGKIYGRILCEGSNEPVDFVTVSIRSAADSTLVAGTVSDTSGNFCFYLLENNLYYIEISDAGFVQKRLDELKISPDQNKLDLGDITITPCSKTGKRKNKNQDKESENSTVNQ